ncbi:hypothetical protein [Paenibacillus ginsengihumi]|uniref:hypothetical protein n=1 Tax=Paenibacillus ginsengihumi TaxID=431596 RepID=UPI0003806F31|nr:hypothetical protein [Paenibacillus ginsengihumi]
MNSSDVVFVQLDRPRELRYGYKALKTLVALTGKSLEEIEQEGLGNFELVEKLIYCGLLKDARDNAETLKLEQIEDLIDMAPSYKHVIDAVTKAFLAAFGAEPGQDQAGNQQQPAQQPRASEKDSTSPKA